MDHRSVISSKIGWGLPDSLMNYTYPEISQRLDGEKTHKHSHQIFIPFCPPADGGLFIFRHVRDPVKCQWCGSEAR